MSSIDEPRHPVICKRCNHYWLTKITPKRCARCRSIYWNTDYTRGKPVKCLELERSASDGANKYE